MPAIAGEPEQEPQAQAAIAPARAQATPPPPPPLPPVLQVGAETDPQAPIPAVRPRTRALREIFWGRSNALDLKFHVRHDCMGLRNANGVSGHMPCQICIGQEFIQQIERRELKKERGS